MNSKLVLVTCITAILLTGCSLNTSKNTSESETESSTVNNTSNTSETTDTTETEESIVEKSAEEIKAVSEWLNESINDSEEFTDKTNYQYYARTLGLDKDYFLNPDLWEIYLNEEININSDIDNKTIFLIRLNPNKLLEIYAENNESTVEDICSSLSVTPAQLYYNFGSTVASNNYTENHKDNLADYSEAEENIFGKANGEDRKAVLRTHELTVDSSDKYAVSYLSEPDDTLEIKRRDLLKNTSDSYIDYNLYSEDEKNAAFTVNGIGIRYVIPLTLENARTDAENKQISPYINYSPYSYGCTDEDIIILPTISGEVQN